MSDISLQATTFDRYRAARATLLLGFACHPAPRDLGTVHSPTRTDRPAIIAQRYWCPSCDAPAGEPCRLGDFPQGYSHVARHHAARRADWAQLLRESRPVARGLVSTGFMPGPVLA